MGVGAPGGLRIGCSLLSTPWTDTAAVRSRQSCNLEIEKGKSSTGLQVPRAAWDKGARSGYDRGA